MKVSYHEIDVDSDNTANRISIEPLNLNNASQCSKARRMAAHMDAEARRPPLPGSCAHCYAVRPPMAASVGYGDNWCGKWAYWVSPSPDMS